MTMDPGTFFVFDASVLNPCNPFSSWLFLIGSMIIRVQPGLGTPIYLQIESQLKHATAAGALMKSEKLRRLRPIATQLAVEAKQLRLARSELLQLLENSYDNLESR